MVSGGAFALRLSSSLLSGAWEPVPWGESTDPLLSHYSFPDSPSPGGSPKNLAEDSLQFQADPLFDDYLYPVNVQTRSIVGGRQ